MENSCIRRGRHCIFALHAHLVFVTKYRGRCFTTKHLAILQKSFTEVCTDFGASLKEMNGDRDHVHLLITYPPTVSLSKLVNSLKGVSSRLLRKQMAEDFETFFGPHLWSPSYFVASCGGAPLTIIQEYIKNQDSP